MGSKERIQRLKDDTRLNILEAALQIVKEEGWQSLSMRKIADVIEYTAPIIYEYFANKEGILLELTRKGYMLLGQDIQKAKSEHRLPEKQIEAMWIAYWNFAFQNKELYKLMFGVEMNCCELKKAMPEAEFTTGMFNDVISELIDKEKLNEELLCRKYYTYWSIVHGLISINLVQKGTNDAMNQHILSDAINGITRFINN